MTHIPKNLSVQYLAKHQHALLTKLYRSHASRMRITPQADVWVVRNPALIAGLCLSPVAHGYWLISLFTAPQYRQQGVASLLVEKALLNYPNSPIWLFCNPKLQTFYHTLGFLETQDLPEQLSDRLARYQQHKNLIAMQNTEPRKQG